MKSFFDDIGSYNKHARDFSKEVTALIGPLMEKYAKDDFNPRDMVLLITDQAMMEEICLRGKKHKAELARKRFLEAVDNLRTERP